MVSYTKKIPNHNNKKYSKQNKQKKKGDSNEPQRLHIELVTSN